MEMPFVSIIVPVYNAQSHLSRCLESICGQEYKNLELIVINDGSKDKSLPVCEEFRKKDSRILLVDKANSGVSDTRNLGLKLAGGKYVQFVDSDDYIAPDYTARLVEAAEKTGADLVISPYTMVIPAGASKPEQVLEKIQDDLGVMHVARPPENREYGFLPEGVYDKDTFARRLMDKPASYFYSVLWNKLYRRDILTRHDIRFTSEMRWAEDLVFNMQYIQYAEIFASIPQPGYYYVQNPQSICHTQIKPATLVQNKIQVFHYYKDLYTRLGMYEQVRPQLYKFLIDIAESTYPSGPFKKVIDEAKAYWKEHRAEIWNRNPNEKQKRAVAHPNLQSRCRSTAPLPRGASGEDIKLYEMPKPPSSIGKVALRSNDGEVVDHAAALSLICYAPMAAHFLANQSRSSSVRRGASFSKTSRW